ncbi:site-2 protease family protein [Flammeovirga kamogawensis]|nr:site-2 protease family protein [Flammeovirga kamogawensis]MBB6459969.1 membrane-associated protease RseP (regulator of RpoE activity) [Flammeovirga kamogawensis]
MKEIKDSYQSESDVQIEAQPLKKKTVGMVWWKHLLLFLLTVCATTFAGAEWIYGKSVLMNELTPKEWIGSLSYSLPFLGILTVHEFGHYFTAKYYKLKVTLPYYIPVWLFSFGPSIGSFGAFIKIKSVIKTRTQFFDIGVSGPLAGFIAALFVLAYGFTHLPPPEYIYQIHPEYQKWGLDYAKYAYENLPMGESLSLGSNLLFEFFKHFVAPDPSLVPNGHEMMHYPFLFAGYLACFFTALNLLPFGQLDGGHALYSIIGTKWFNRLLPFTFAAFLFWGGLGLFSAYDSSDVLITYAPLYVAYLFFVSMNLFENKVSVALYAMSIFTLQFVFSTFTDGIVGYQGWLFFGFLLSKVLGLHHPPALYKKSVDTKRKIIGIITLIVFILCFTPTPFILE